MATTTLKTRIQHKYDTPENWAKATTFVPLKGEICVFNNGTGVKPEMKIGDGATTLASLPFLKAGGDIAVSRSLTSGTKIATITIDGVATDLYCETNTDTNTTYSAGTGISLSGTAFSLATSGVTAGSYGPTANVSGSNGATINVPQITVDAYGRVTGVVNRTYTSVNTDTNTTYSAGTGLSLSGTTFSQVARTFTIGNGSFSYNGSANVSLATHSIFTSFTSDYTISWDDLPVGFTEMSGSNEVDWSGTNNPTGMTGFYKWGGALTLNRGGTGAFAQMYFAHSASSGHGILYRSGWYTDKKAWARILDSNTYTDYTVTKTGSGASGTWGISITGSAASCTGNAATATALTTSAGSSTVPIYFSSGKPVQCSTTLGVSITGNAATATTLSSTLAISKGGTGATINNAAYTNLMYQGDVSNGDTALKRGLYGYATSATNVPNVGGYGCIYNVIANNINEGVAIGNTTSSSWVWQLGFSTSNISMYIRNSVNAQAFNSWKRFWLAGDSITGAVWNDYAEYRESDCQEFGRVLIENGDDTLSPSTERLQPFAGISSDTWGFCQGETDRAKTPIAVAGRVLAYPYRNRNEYQPGDCLCAAPNGTVDIMTREEVERYPDRIVGTVSCVPDYEEWGSGDRPAVQVDGRIWVKVR